MRGLRTRHIGSHLSVTRANSDDPVRRGTYETMTGMPEILHGSWGEVGE